MDRMRLGMAAAWLLACGSAASAQLGPVPAGPEDDAPAATTGPQARAEFVLETLEVDFGSISDELPVQRKVKFTNNGGKTLTISSVHAGCGCTQPKLDKMVYAPGEAGTIDVQYNPAHKRGFQQTTITVNSDDPVNPTRTIAVKSNVQPVVYTDPMSITFNQVRKNTGAMSNFKIVSRIKDFQVTGITSSNANVEAKAGEGKAIKLPDGADAIEVPVEVILKKEAPVGMAQGTLTIRTNSEKHLLSQQVFGQVTGDVVVTPSNLPMGLINTGAAIKQQLKVSTRDNQPGFTIAKVVCTSAPGMAKVELQAAVKDDPGSPPNGPKSYLIEITGIAPAQAAALQGEVQITTNIPGEELIKVNYYGSVRAPVQNSPGTGTSPVGMGEGKPTFPTPSPKITGAPASQPTVQPVGPSKPSGS